MVRLVLRWSRSSCRRGGIVCRLSCSLCRGGICVRLCSRSCSSGVGGWLVVRELDVHGRYLERHLVGWREKRLIRGVHGDDLISPRIATKEAGERHCGLLLEVLVVELGTLGHHRCEPEGGVGIALDEAVSDEWLVEALERLDARLKLLEIEAEVLLTAIKLLCA